MNDVVYLLGSGSTLNNIEIKYSLRSLEMYLQGVNNVYIIGKRPYFLNDQAIEIPFKDVYKNKAHNIMAKINRAANDERITDRFMVFNDDYFLLQPTSAVEYPYYYKCDLQRSVEINLGEYEKHCRATLEILKEHGKTTLNFDSHYPIIYNKKRFAALVNIYNWNIPFGYISKSMYCNHYGIKGEYLQDCKISNPYTYEQLKRLNSTRHMFSVEDKAVNVHMSRYLKELYPNKSKFEL